jgi:ferredoxin
MGTIRQTSEPRIPGKEDDVEVQVSVDADLCIGSGDCVNLLPEAFRLDEALGVSVVLDGAQGVDPARLIAAARGCPTQAIRVVADGVVLHASNG